MLNDFFLGGPCLLILDTDSKDFQAGDWPSGDLYQSDYLTAQILIIHSI